MTSQTIIHIGYHKTGTTWLQRVIFPKLSAQCDINIISRESFSGSLVSDNYQMAKTLVAQYPEAKIIMTIRNQPDMLMSLYWLYVKSGGSKKYQHYANEAMTRGKLNYDQLIHSYQETFTKEKVLVLCYEVLKKDPKKFVKKIIDFCDVHVDIDQLWQDITPSALNKSPSVIEMEITRVTNKIIRFAGKSISQKIARCLRYIASIIENKLLKLQIDKQKFYNDKLAKKIDSAYAVSNSKLIKDYHMDINGKGYPL